MGNLKSLLTPVIDEEEKDNLLKFRLVLEAVFWFEAAAPILLTILWSLRGYPIWTWSADRKLLLVLGVPLGVTIIYVLHHVVPKRVQLIPLLSYFESFFLAFTIYLIVRYTDGLFSTGGTLRAHGIPMATTGSTYFFLFIPLMVLAVGLQAELVIPVALFIDGLIATDIVHDFFWGSGHLAYETAAHPVAMASRIIYILLFGYFARYLAREAWQQRQARVRMERLDQQKNIFVELAAHNLRTPITSIRGYLTVLLEQTQGLTNEEKDYLTKAVTSSNKLQEISENLLRISELETEGWQGRRETADLKTLVQEVIDSYQGEAQEKQVKVSFLTPPEPLSTSLNPEQIKLALDCLINNAIKFNKPQGKVEVRLKSEDKTIIGEIEDTGIGIPEDKLPYIFAKFYRATSVMEYEYAGAGIGLYLARLIFRQHQGDLTVTSTLGKGSTFTFKIPKVTSEEKKEPPVKNS